MHYTDVRRSLGAVDDEKGIAWELVVKGNHVQDETPAQLRGSFDYGFPLPHSRTRRSGCAAPRASASGDRDNPVANFYFGGFGNNYVDSGSVKRYREYDSMPGFEHRRDQRRRISCAQMVEWNLPPVVFESVGTPGVLPATGCGPRYSHRRCGPIPANSALRKNYQSVGAQVDLRFSVLHWYDMTLSVGYAVGFQRRAARGDEWMVSLKIL